MRSPRSLRARLLIVTLALTALGLAVAGGVTYGALNSFLRNRVDDQLQASSDRAFRGRRIELGEFDGRRPGRPGEDPTQNVAGLIGTDGRVVSWPNADVAVPTRPATGYTEATLGRAGDYRLLTTSPFVVQTGPGLTEEVVGIVGVSLRDLNATLDRLLVIELLVGLGVLGAVGGAGFALVRLGLKPLADIETTAGHIASGDLSQRIEDESADTEVGRLGRSLNVMLGKIEESFAEREASERRLRQFVADASHELQTPLTSVRGYAELFRRGAADRPEDLAVAMRRIEAEAERMGVLVDDLLLLARLDQGRPLEREPVDLTAAVRELAGDAMVVDPEHPITVNADGQVGVIGDEVRLRQVIANLLSNARTHTPPGTAIAVDVTQDGAEAVIAVADRGPGIQADHLARVFERFFRADVSRARTSGGTGLGLSIVAAIARAHGGSAHVEAPEGGGARFEVRLPLEGPPAGAPSAEPAASAGDGPGSPQPL